MFSREENERLTRVGPASAMGAVMRCYWLPALLSEEIPHADCPPVRVRLLGEDLVAFRDSNGKPGLLAEHCSHRGTSLFYGRSENCGLTCIYHGWTYDVEGRVLETPAEPQSSDFKQKLRHKAYPCVEHAGIVFAYLGTAEKAPLFPAYEWVSTPAPNRHVIKAYLECNYLQGLEGDFDSSHTTFLHCNNIADLGRLNRDGAPQLQAEESRYGLRAISVRRLGDGQKYARVSPFIMPSFSIVPGPATARFQTHDPRAFRFWVPIDDTSTWLYILTMRDLPFSEEEKARGRSWVDGSYRRLLNARNNYMQDRQLQKTLIYSGIKCVIPAEQDGCATESMGHIYDRTKEHLGYSDKIIIALRKFLLKAVKALEEGKDPPHVIRDAAANDFRRLRAVKGVLAGNGSWLELPDKEDAL